jgi:hypothetical protein
MKEMERFFDMSGRVILFLTQLVLASLGGFGLAYILSLILAAFQLGVDQSVSQAVSAGAVVVGTLVLGTLFTLAFLSKMRK